MTRTTAGLLAILPIVAATACPGDHGHDPAGAHDDHVHGDHGPAHGPERPDVSVTVYESGLELFMEYPALVVGEPSPLIAHLTDARDPEGFRPVTEGRVVVTLRYADAGGLARFTAGELLRTGIFRPIVTPTREGKATLTVELTGPVSGVVTAGEVTVFADAAAAAALPEQESGEPTVSYLKEAQWKTVYATALAEERALRGGIRASGEIRAVPGKAAELAAAVQGRVAAPGEVPRLGQPVRKGELLAILLPIGADAGASGALLEAEVARARAELGLAERDLQRAEELLEAAAAPEKQVDEATVGVEVARARLAAAEKQLALQRSHQTGSTEAVRSAFELRSPIDGVVAFADVTPGEVVAPGRRLISVVDTERVWLVVHAPEREAARVHDSPGARFEIAGLPGALVVDEQNGARVAVGAVIDPVTRTVPVIFELANPGSLKPGMFAKATLFTGETVRGVAVPEEALIDDGGRPTVYVMDGGESFFARRVRTGVREGGFVQILEGVGAGERVVSRGAYEIKLASSAGGIPEHGHSH